MSNPKPRLFVGRGHLDDDKTRRWRTEIDDEQQCASLIAQGRMDNPADYSADPGLVDAMNVALLLGRPLLLTGRPGTGKSQFADRAAWEFDLAPVLRFEAQSISEARDLFYTFDMVGRMAAAQPGADAGRADAERFVTLAALGKAVVYSKPLAGANAQTATAERPGAAAAGIRLDPAHPAPLHGRASVVLIDEIDKASRDFPNDLLNAIERFSFEIPELEGRRFEAARTPDTRPIVIITSNSERELPEPFLRRCVFYNIPDPTPQTLARIVAARVLSPGDGSAPPAELPTLFRELVECFVAYRKKAGREVVFAPGTSELIDLARVVAADGEAQPDEPLRHDANVASARRAASAVAKGKGDADAFVDHLGKWSQPP
jgi:MoxR-like ATPase